MVNRIDIEKALDELISNEEGMRFQGLAVVLAKQKWPGLIASERKWDLGLDAHASALISPDGTAIGLACSLTATLAKVRSDAGKIREHYGPLSVLIFATANTVTKHTEKAWADTIRTEYGFELIVMGREDIITDLMMPSNAPVCRGQLGIQVALEEPVATLLNRAREAAVAEAAAWLRHPRLAGKPLLTLQAIRLDEAGQETTDSLDVETIHTSLRQGRRIVLEAPAGRGKTTTLVQLALRQGEGDGLAFLVDLPGWTGSRQGILEFIAHMPQFLSRGIGPQDLARLYQGVPCSFLLNGWNELSDASSENAVPALAQLERAFPMAGIIVATRSHHISPPLPGSFRARLRALTPAQRAAYLSQALGARANELRSQLEGNRSLDDLTRTPLILSEITTLFRSEAPLPTTKLGILQAVMRLLEQSEEHRDHLQRQPLSGHAVHYLSELAVQMTTRGDVMIAEEDGRSVVRSVSEDLQRAGQIAQLPEPASALHALCAHHVLERLEYPSVAFRFQHQQFQEFYAAVALKRQLSTLVDEDNPAAKRRFGSAYVNQPAWEEPLRMIAEEIGGRSSETPADVLLLARGRVLLEIALPFDAIFTAELARLCGPAVWNTIRSALGERLRAWYSVADEQHQQCALAGMLASGSDDFADIVLPLLSGSDQQIRLSTYRAWNEFHISTLGSEWRRVVVGWSEECREDFVGEIMRHDGREEIAEELARTDPSPSVRKQALRALSWLGANETIARVLADSSDTVLEDAVREGIVGTLSESLRDRVRTVYDVCVRTSTDPGSRLRMMLTAASVGVDVAEDLKDELAKWPSRRIESDDAIVLESALAAIQKADPQWVSYWVAERVVDGTLWHGEWTKFVSSVPRDLRRTLLERLSGQDLQHKESSSIAILAAAPDPADAAAAFDTLCKIESAPPAPEPKEQEARRAIVHQLQALLRTLPPNVALSGILSRLAVAFGRTEHAALVEVLSHGLGEESEPRPELADGLRQELRTFLKRGASLALDEDDFWGHLKANSAVALARVGNPEDMTELSALIRADIARVRAGLAARSAGRRGGVADGAVMRWSSWYTRSVVWLDPRGAEGLLLELLSEPEYENDAGVGLILLAMNANPQRALGHRGQDYRTVWDVRAGKGESRFDDARRRRYSTAIRARVSVLVAERDRSPSPDSYNGRLKALASRLATLDGRESAPLVVEMMALQGAWDGWTRVEALHALLFSGAHLDANATVKVLDPTIEAAVAARFGDNQAVYLLRRALCLLPFVEPPSVGVARVREVLAATKLRGHELQDVVTALGQSRCSDAVGVLVELAKSAGNGFGSFATEWVDALAALDTADARRALWSFVDPEVEDLGIRLPSNGPHDRARLATHLADLARVEPRSKERIIALCATPLPASKRALVAEVIAHLGTPDVLVAGLNLIRDDANPRVPYELKRAIESVCLERRPYGDTSYAYTLKPRSCNEIRIRVADMIANDDDRGRSAFALLGQMEAWRVEYGRPIGEPRHPLPESGEPWPPIRPVEAGHA